MVIAAVLTAELVAGAAMVAPAIDDPATLAQSEVAVERRLVPVSLGGARTDALLSRVSGQFSGAVAAVERFWGTDWQREIMVVASGSDAQFVAEAGLDPRRRWSDIAAVTVADDVDPVRRVVGGQRIVLAPGAAEMSDPALRIVLGHELFHLAARADTALDAPRWLTEGVADFVARAPAPLPPWAAANTELPSDAALETEGPKRSAAYDRAWWFARFVADSYGGDALRRLYLKACGPGQDGRAVGLPDSVGPVLGTDMAALRDGWARWLTRGGSPVNVSGDGSNPPAHQ